MPRFLLFLCTVAGEFFAPLQMNAHSGAMPKSFSSSESQLHRGACLGIAFVDEASEGTNTNGETRCLRSVIVIVAYIVYYNDCIIIRVFLCFYLRVCLSELDFLVLDLLMDFLDLDLDLAPP